MFDLAKMEIKDIAASVAMVCLLFGLAINLPILGFFFALFIPLPILYSQKKLGRFQGNITAGISALVVFLISGGFGADLLFFAELLLIGVMLGRCFEKQISVEGVVLVTCLAVLGSGTAGLILYSLNINQSIGTLVSVYIMRSLELSMILYKSAGMPEESVRILSESLNEIQYVLVRISPALITAMTMLIVWVNVLTSRPLFSATGLSFPPFGRLNRWRAPEFLVWPVIGCGLMLLLPANTIKMVGLNGLIVLLTIYFFQGIGIVAFFFEQKHFSKIARILLYGLIVVQQLLLMIVVSLGFFDTWIDFRKLDKKID